MRNSTFKLGDITEVITKGTTPTSVGFKFVESGINFVKVESITADGLFLTSKFASISDECNKTLNRSQLREGDVLFSIAGALGRTALVPKSILPANTNQALAIIRLKRNIAMDKRFLLLALKTSVTMEQVEKYRGGVAQQNLSLGQLKNFEIPNIPLSNQQRIVAILDQAFAEIEQAQAKAEQNLKNARELFESYLQQVFSLSNEKRADYNLSDICEINSKLIDPKKVQYQDLPHIGAGNMVSSTGEIIDIKTAKEEGLISGKFVFDNSMVLYSKIRPYLMKVCRPDFIGLCSADVYPLYPHPEKLSKDYLFFLLLSKDFTDYAISGSGRAGMPKVNRTHLFKYQVSLPDLEQQKKYVTCINQVSVKVQALEKLYILKLAKLDELKKSILQKAFTGELTKVVK
jgi:type I restriction enzyme, S subunit